MPPDAASVPRRRTRATNALVEPPFQLPGAAAAQAPQELPVWHRFCPCTRFTPYGNLPPHLSDNSYILTGYRVVRRLRG